MDRTSELWSIAGVVEEQKSAEPSAFLLKANETSRQIEAFESLVRRLRDSFVNYHRYLPRHELKKVKYLTERDRSAITQEVVTFISSASAQIQGLNGHLEDILAEDGSATARSQHCRLIISFLLNKLSAFTALSDRMQKEYRSNAVNPCRLMADRYSGCVRDVKDGGEETDPEPAPKSSGFFSRSATETKESSTPIDAPVVTTPSKPVDTFAQRYVDEIASRNKLREYDAIASKQKESLLREAKILKVKFSEDIQESQKMERTVNNISSMINEFVQLIESQSAMVDTIGEVSQDATESVKSTDAELLLTLERSQSHQWSMIMFIAGMALLLLLLDFLSP